MTRFVNPRPQFFGSDGHPLVEGNLFFYNTGTLVPKTTYKDVNLTQPNDHPVELDGDGRVKNIFFTGPARCRLEDSQGGQIFDIDPVGSGFLTGPFSEWLPEFTYSLGNIVIDSNNNVYRSITNGNRNNDPTTSVGQWESVEFISIWNPNINYSLGDTVKASDNLFYRSLVESNLNNDPLTSPAEWGDIVPIQAFWTPSVFIDDADSPFLASNTDRLAVDVTTNPVTVNLPADPSNGDRVRIADILRNSAFNNITVGRNGQTIDEATDDFIIDINGLSLDFEFDATVPTWRLS